MVVHGGSHDQTFHQVWRHYLFLSDKLRFFPRWIVGCVLGWRWRGVRGCLWGRLLDGTECVCVLGWRWRGVRGCLWVWGSRLWWGEFCWRRSYRWHRRDWWWLDVRARGEDGRLWHAACQLCWTTRQLIRWLAVIACCCCCCCWWCWWWWWVGVKGVSVQCECDWQLLTAAENQMSLLSTMSRPTHVDVCDMWPMYS